MKHKERIQKFLETQFDDQHFIQNIKALYPLIRNKVDSIITDEEKSSILPLVLSQYHVYGASLNKSMQGMLDYHAFIPVKIDFNLFDCSQNNNFKEVSYDECDHNHAEQSPLEFVTKSVVHSLSTPDQMEREYDSEDSLHLFPCNDGCCRDCASVITTSIIAGCYMYVPDDVSYATHFIEMCTIPPDGSGPKNIVAHVDKLSMLCLWTANILQHRYIKLALEWNHDLMPTIILALFRLMIYAHVLYRKDVKLYMNRRRNVYHSIWRLLQQIILYHHYIKKYYNRYDVEKNRFCDQYIVGMSEWLRNEVQIQQDLAKMYRIEQQPLDHTGSYAKSLCHDYVGGVIILMSLVAKNESFDMRMMQCTEWHGFVAENVEKNGGCAWVTIDILRFAHSVTNCRKELAKFWKESIIRCRN